MENTHVDSKVKIIEDRDCLSCITNKKEILTTFSSLEATIEDKFNTLINALRSL